MECSDSDSEDEYEDSDSEDDHEVPVEAAAAVASAMQRWVRTGTCRTVANEPYTGLRKALAIGQHGGSANSPKKQAHFPGPGGRTKHCGAAAWQAQPGRNEAVCAEPGTVHQQEEEATRPSRDRRVMDAREAFGSSAAKRQGARSEATFKKTQGKSSTSTSTGRHAGRRGGDTCREGCRGVC